MKKVKFYEVVVPICLVTQLVLIICCQCQNLAADVDLSATSSSNANSNPSGQATDKVTLISPQDTQYTVRVGETLTIPCVIENRKHATVIWQYSKNKIPETLTIGYFYYRKDYRIRVIANTSQEAEQSWNLEIRKVKLEDEGYYLCKVMAEPESLKRVVYLKVEVDLRMHSINHHQQHNQPVTLDHNVVLICNTSYAIKESKSASSSSSSSGNHGSHQAGMRVMWFKDNEPILINDQHHHHSKHQQHSEGVPNDSKSQSGSSELNSKFIHVVNNNSVLNYKIEYSSKPVLWSKLIIKLLQPVNLGVYTCSFRNQSVSLLVSLESGKCISFNFLEHYNYCG
jgi:hypothetical protein